MILCKSISQLPSCKQFPAIFQVWLYWYRARRTVKVCNIIQHETSKTALKLVDQMMQIRPSAIMYMYFSYKDQQTISMKEWKNVNKTFNNWSPCYHKQHRKRCTLQTIWTSSMYTTHNTQLPGSLYNELHTTPRVFGVSRRTVGRGPGGGSRSSDAPTTTAGSVSTAADGPP